MINIIKAFLFNRTYGFSQDVDGDIIAKVWAYKRHKDNVMVIYKTIVTKNGKKLKTTEIR